MSWELRLSTLIGHQHTRRRFAMTNSANLQAKHRQPNVRCNVNSNDAFCLPDPFLESFFLTHLDGEAEKTTEMKSPSWRIHASKSARFSSVGSNLVFLSLSTRNDESWLMAKASPVEWFIPHVFACLRDDEMRSLVDEEELSDRREREKNFRVFEAAHAASERLSIVTQSTANNGLKS